MSKIRKTDLTAGRDWEEYSSTNLVPRFFKDTFGVDERLKPHLPISLGGIGKEWKKDFGYKEDDIREILKALVANYLVVAGEEVGSSKWEQRRVLEKEWEKPRMVYRVVSKGMADGLKPRSDLASWRTSEMPSRRRIQRVVGDCMARMRFHHHDLLQELYHYRWELQRSGMVVALVPDISATYSRTPKVDEREMLSWFEWFGWGKRDGGE